MSKSVFINRLMKFKNIEMNIISKDRIQLGIQLGYTEINHFLQDIDDLTYHNFSEAEHIGRVIYFINHPNQINPIVIDNFCGAGMPSCEAIIADGVHRLSAAVYLGWDKIDIEYSGLEDTLDYLTGKIDQIPIKGN